MKSPGRSTHRLAASIASALYVTRTDTWYSCATSGAGRVSPRLCSPDSILSRRPAGTAWRRRAGCRAGTGRRRVRAGPCRPGQARSRCRAATRRLPADQRQRREQAPGCVPVRPRPGRAPSGGGRDSWVVGIAAALAPQVDLNTGAARTALASPPWPRSYRGDATCSSDQPILDHPCPKRWYGHGNLRLRHASLRPVPGPAWLTS